jgi:hypothetical protein
MSCGKFLKPWNAKKTIFADNNNKTEIDSIDLKLNKCKEN